VLQHNKIDYKVFVDIKLHSLSNATPGDIVTVILPVTLGHPKPPQTTSISTFCIAFHIFIVGEHRDFKFRVGVDHSKSQPIDGVKARVPSKELRERLGIDNIILVLQQSRLRWYGHVL